MGARFYIETGDEPQRPHRWPEDLRAITFGRGADNFLRIDDDQSSRRHVSITRKRGRYVLRDLNSRNGTLVNGKPVDKAALTDGARIRIGATAIRFAVDTEPAYPASGGFLDRLPEDRVSLLCILSVGVSVFGLCHWLVSACAMVLGLFAAVNVTLRPKLRGVWLGVLGAALGGSAFAYHFVSSSVAPALQTWDSAQAKIECRKRLGRIQAGLRRFQSDHGGRGPASLRELTPRYVPETDTLYCPAAEKQSGKRAAAAAFVYFPENLSRSRTDRWVVRDPTVEGHGDGGAAVFPDGPVRWFRRHEFVERLRKESP